VDRAFWVESKSFLQYKAASGELKRGNTCEPVFSPRRRLPLLLNYIARGEIVTAVYIHKALAKI
jgi:hypothetical protein